MSFDTYTFAVFVLEISARAAAAALAVAGVLRFFRIGAPTLRHAAWTTVLAAMLLMPLLPSVVPALPLALPSAVAAADDAVWSPLTETMPASPVVSPAVASQPPAVAPTAATTPTAARRPLWPSLVFGVYLVGVLFWTARLLYGWYVVNRMLGRACVASGFSRKVNIVESAEVAVPMTAGVLRPVIVLPTDWKSWPAEKLSAVLAHEGAHVRRRDTLTALTARINRTLFWFHPLAWWLERKLAVTAEHACDEAAAREIQEPRRYAEILVEMADVVRRNRGRMVWQGVGVDGGLLQGRIERVLRGEVFARPSAKKQVAALLACATVILLVVACRKNVPALQPDPELSKQLADEDARMKKFASLKDMTVQDAEALEQKLAANPQDFDTREKLSWYYQTSLTVPWDKKVPGLRRHALWLIENAPEHDVAPPTLSRQYDPEGYAAAKRLWDAHLAKPNVSPFVVYRAARFYTPHDKAYAETLILRGLSMDPESAALKARMRPNVGGYEWRSQLANLYASALFGSESMWGTSNDLRIRKEKLADPFAAEVRKKLDASTDARLLASVGGMLARYRSPLNEPAQAEVKAAQELGVSYLRRALELDPNLESAKRSLYLATAADTRNDADRLADKANERFMVSEDISEYAKKDPSKAKGEREEARQAAQQALELAKAHQGDPSYSAAAMTAHQVLAAIALRDGDREQAVTHLRESVKVPTSDRIKYAPPFAWSRPVNRLLTDGERERIVEFLEAFAQLVGPGSEGDRLRNDAKAIRDGRMPVAYQHMMNREWNAKQKQDARKTVGG
jgi:beta-lactamase regulating signal transducer with metallopeptidase domain